MSTLDLMTTPSVGAPVFETANREELKNQIRKVFHNALIASVIKEIEELSATVNIWTNVHMTAAKTAHVYVGTRTANPSLKWLFLPPIDPAVVKHVAALSKLALSREEHLAMANDLGKISEHVARLREVHVEHVADWRPWAGVGSRDDVPVKSLTREDALRNAPDKEEGFFRVPRVVE